jgi:hypothetical protein
MYNAKYTYSCCTFVYFYVQSESSGKGSVFLQSARIFLSAVAFVPLNHLGPVKLGGDFKKSGVISIAYKGRRFQFHLLLTAPTNGCPLRTTHPSKGAFRMRSEMRGGCGVCGRSRKPLPGDPGIGPAGTTTGARGASLKRGAKGEGNAFATHRVKRGLD